jgi:hypothetical protein
MRHVKIWVVICVLLCGLTGGPAHAATRYEAGIATSATLLWMSDAKLAKRLDDIKTLGATWIRVDFTWPAIQPDNPREYHWQLYDHVVKAATTKHLKILAVVGYTPPWAREPQCAALEKNNETSAQKCAPRSNDEFGRFAGAIAKRYAGQSIRGWEIWNEPNLSGYWKTAQPDRKVFVDPKAYAGIANAAAAQIRRYNPDSAVVTGGLSPMFEPSYPAGMRQSDYLAQLLPRLNAHLFDGVSIHPYTWPVLPSKQAVYNAFYTVDNGKPEYNLRTVMADAGWGNKEIWGTEFGASTIGVSSVSRPTKSGRPDHVSESMQAQIIKQGITDWYAKPNVGPIFVHSDSDQWLQTHKNEGGFGLRRSDGSKKAAYSAFQAAARRLRQ